MSDGVKVSDWGKPFKDAINISKQNRVTFITRAEDDATGYMVTPKVRLYNALSGNIRLLKDGKILPGKGGNATYPQSAIGHTADRRLILFVSDGRTHDNPRQSGPDGVAVPRSGAGVPSASPG